MGTLLTQSVEHPIVDFGPGQDSRVMGSDPMRLLGSLSPPLMYSLTP